MKWSFVLDGQPPSTNNMYTQIVCRTKSGVPYRSVKKNAAVESYQIGATYQAKLAKPSGWTWKEGYLRVNLDFYLKRDIDCDNAMKSLLDALAIALGVDDKVFLPCARSKTIKDPRPRVIVEVDDGVD